MSDTLQTFCVSKPILLTSISILWRTWSPAHTHTQKPWREHVILGISISLQNKAKLSWNFHLIVQCWLVCVCLTWATEMNVLVFIISAASQTPGMIGQGEQVLQPGWVSYGPVQALDPLLALLERCKVASVENTTWRAERLVRSNHKICHYNTRDLEKNRKNSFLQMFSDFPAIKQKQ